MPGLSHPGSMERARRWSVAGGVLGLATVGTAIGAAALTWHGLRDLMGMGALGGVVRMFAWFAFLVWGPLVGSWLLVVLALSIRALRVPGSSSLVLGLLAAAPALPLAWVSMEDAAPEPAVMTLVLATTAVVNVIAWRGSTATARSAVDRED